MKKNTFIIGISFVISNSIFVLNANAINIFVGSSRSITTISQGIATANNGDTIIIDDGTYYESSLIVDKQLTIKAANIGKAIIDGNGANTAIIDARTDSMFSGFQVTNASIGIWLRHTDDTSFPVSLIPESTVQIERIIASNLSLAAFNLDQTGGQKGSIDIVNSTVLDSFIAARINDGNTINITNTIIDNVEFAYNNGNGKGINPMNNLLNDVNSREGFGNIPGPIFGDPFEIVADPSFVDRQGGDFRLENGSPAIDSGKDVGLPFNGSNPDIGAFESEDVPEPLTILGTLLAASLGIVMKKRKNNQDN